MTITLQLDFLGWVGFIAMILFALGAVYLVISAMFLRSHGDYDFGIPILFAGKFLFAVICALISVFLYLVTF